MNAPEETEATLRNESQAFYRPPSVDMIDWKEKPKVEVESCPNCGGPANFWPDLMYASCAAENCRMIGPSKDKEGIRWNRLSRLSRFSEGLKSQIFES